MCFSSHQLIKAAVSGSVRRMAVAEPATASTGGPSWATMAVKEAVKKATAPSVPLVTEGTTAVVDTNAVVALSAAQVSMHQRT